MAKKSIFLLAKNQILIVIIAVLIILALLLLSNPSEAKPSWSTEYQAAVMSADSSSCDSLAEGEKELCKNMVSDLELFETALETKDSSLCSQISGETIKGNCNNIFDNGIPSEVRII
jgi:hypothetical protein